MKQVLICGAGMSATDLISYMLTHAKRYDWQVTVGDIDVDTARKKLEGHPRGRAVFFDCYDDELMDQHIKGADLIVSLLPPGMHAAAAKIALRHRAHVVTASYASEEMINMHDAAKANGLTFLNELGADPGIDHMNGMRSIDQIRKKGGRLLSFESYCGSLMAPESNDNPWGYKFTWSPMNVITAGDAGARYYQNGELRCLPYQRVFANPQHIDVPGLGQLEAYPNRDSAQYRTKYNVDDTPTFIRATLRYPGFCEGWNNLVKLGLTANNYRIPGSETMTYRQWVSSYLPTGKKKNLEQALSDFLSIEPGSEALHQLLWAGLLSDEPIQTVNGTPAEILHELLRQKLTFESHDTDMLVFYERIGYELDGEHFEHTSHLVTKGLDHWHTAISRTVGLPAAIGAKRILNGEINTRGVLFPWIEEVYEPVLNELETLGIGYTSFDQRVAKLASSA